MRSTPTSPLEALLNIEPLHIHIKEIARATKIRRLISINQGIIWPYEPMEPHDYPKPRTNNAVRFNITQPINMTNDNK